MMVTHGDDGMIARPMRGIMEQEGNSIWFFSDRNTETARDAKATQDCCLTFADLRGQTFVSACGQIELVEDRAEIKRLWTEGASVYFPHGVQDEAIVLLKFTPESAAYWDAPSNPVVLAIKFLQAKASGKRPALGTNAAVAM